jgi:hypothetical protein
MTMEQDLLARTGQLWKLRLQPISIFSGTALVVAAIWLWFQREGDGSYIFPLVLGLAFNIAGFLIPLLWISCPRCHSRWLWPVYRMEQAHNWYRIMRNMVRCPKCGFYG